MDPYGLDATQTFIRYTPTWTAGSRPTPEIGNGDLHGWLAADHGWAAIRLRIGSTTKLGDGPWKFSCPIANDLGPSLFSVGRQGLAWWMAVGEVENGRLSMHVESTGEPVGPTSPIRWQDGDILFALAGNVPGHFRRQELATSPA